MTEWLKVADCKSVRFYPIVGSNPTFFNVVENYCILNNITPSYLSSSPFFRNMTQSGSVPVLGTGSHVFKSHYFEV